MAETAQTISDAERPLPRTDMPTRPKSWFRPWDWQPWIVAILAVLLVSVALGAIVLSVVWIPDKLVSEATQGSTADQIKAHIDLQNARNAVRTTLLQAIAGSLFLLTAFAAWAQVRTARAGQLTDRFTKSIDQLGSEKLEVRLGGIYALRQIARHRDYRTPVAEILAAFLRQQPEVTAGTGDSPLSRRTRSAIRTRKQRSAGRLGGEVLRSDLQAALRILVQESLWVRSDIGILNLSYASVNNADLRNADLRNALLVGVDLRGADLRGAHLDMADLRFARLDDAVLTDASMYNCILDDASIRNADLSNADLYKAIAHRADFSGAQLSETNITLAQFSDALFVGSTISGVRREKGVGVGLSGADLSRAELYNLELKGPVVSKDTVLTEVLGNDDETVRQLRQLR